MREFTSRPRIFLSSTIYDFRDLRSALKLWLEELGYAVDASEFNDFGKKFDRNSYEACLTAINTADYFVLLIGGRAGGWYDEASKITITMAEYRHAYERAKLGQLKLVIFVRRSVWDVREDRAALRKILQSDYAHEHGLSDEQVSSIIKHQSRIITDAETIFSFLKEVTRVEEMKSATTGSGSLPAANWVHQFDTFRDIVDAFSIELGGFAGIRRIALATNLRHELRENLRHLLERSSKTGQVKPAYQWAFGAREQFRDGPMDSSRISGQRLMRLSLFAIAHANAGRRLSTQFLEVALASGEFLDFDKAGKTYVVGHLQQAMLQLRANIMLLQQAEAALTSKERYGLVQKYGKMTGDKQLHEVPNRDIFGVVSIHDRQANAVKLSGAILGTLDTGTPIALADLKLYPLTPFSDQIEEIEGETPSATDIEKWVAKHFKANL